MATKILLTRSLVAAMPDALPIQPGGRVTGSIRPPGSKSISNRALICAAFASGESQLRGVLQSEDTEVMIESLRRLGIEIASLSNSGLRVMGCGGKIAVDQADLFVGNSGTTVRFLTGVLAACHGHFRLDGVPRMRERPIEDLLIALRQLGADALSVANNKCPPVVIQGQALPGGNATVRGDISSQFLSGLLLAAPLAEGPVNIRVSGPLVSKPYVQMTVAVMRSFGVTVKAHEQEFSIAAEASYLPIDYPIEPDASAASYFWAAAAITGGTVTVDGLVRDALQGDVGFCDCLERMGCSVTATDAGISVTGGELRGADFNMNGISDTVQTLAAVALFARGPTRIRGVAHIRHKETDRIGDLARELRRLGADVEETEDGMVITPGELRGADVETYGDHRMAMSLALVGLRIAGVVVKDPNCTRKTYPEFFADLARVRRM